MWQKIEDILNDPNKLKPMLKETIANLSLRESDLKARIMPIEKSLADIAEQKARLAESWVTQSISLDRQKEFFKKLEQEEARLKSIHSNIDPAQIDELQQTASMLRF